MKKKILIIASHPDDEVLGCGGTICKLTSLGNEVNVFFLSDGVSSRVEKNKNLKIKERKNSAYQAAQIMGVGSVSFGNFPDNEMDGVSLLKVVKKVEAELNINQPDIIFTHHSGDLNIDHQITNKAVLTACRPLGEKIIESILFFEVLSSTEWQASDTAPYFKPNWFVDITNYIDQKIRALEAYSQEMREWPHARSFKALKSLANLRGSTIHAEAAEAFILGRHIN